MFTGIITDVGKVVAVSEGTDPQFQFGTGFDTSELDIGASVCCSGVCLTVTEKAQGCFWVTVSGETLSKTTLGSWKTDTPVNFERALKVGDELGGHIVSGHVDGVGKVESVVVDGDSVRFVFSVPIELAKFIAPKGSIAINGVSLTVNEVEGLTFGVNIIPHTLENTTFGSLSAGDPVNLEIDMLARYVARLHETIE